MDNEFVELRAAEIAAGLEDGGCWMSPFERWGFNDEYPRTRAGGEVLVQTTGQHAGYLARCILDHDSAAEMEGQ